MRVNLHVDQDKLVIRSRPAGSQLLLNPSELPLGRLQGSATSDIASFPGCKAVQFGRSKPVDQQAEIATV